MKPWEEFQQSNITPAAEKKPWEEFAAPTTKKPWEEFAEEGPSQLESFGRGALQGLSLGFADEIAGGIESLATGRSYEKARDESREAFDKAREANPKTSFAGELTGGVAGAFVPGIGWLSKGASIGKAALSGGIAGAGMAKGKDDMLQSVAIGAGLGAGVGALGKGIGAVISRAKPQVRGHITQAASNESLSKKHTAQLASLLDDNADDVQRLTDAQMKTMPTEVPADTKLPSDFINFSRGTKMGTPVSRQDRGRFSDQWSSMAGEVKGKRWEQFQRAKAQRIATSKFIGKYKEELADIKDPLDDELMGYFKDPIFRAMDIDNTVGSDIEGALTTAMQAGHRQNAAMAPFLKQLSTLKKSSDKVFGKDRARITRILEGDDTAADAAEEAVVNQWRGFFKDVAADLETKGYNVKQLTNFAPRVRKSGLDTVRALRNRWEEIRSDYNPEAFMDEGGADSVAIQAHEDFANAIRQLNGGVDPTNSRQITRIIRDATDDMFAKTDLDTSKAQDITALMQRKGEIPALLREDDIVKAASRYVNNTYRGVYFQEVFQRIEQQHVLMDALGFDKSAKWLESLTARLNNEPSALIGSINKTKNRWQDAMNKIIDDKSAGDLQRAIASFGKAAPDAASFLISQAYPNLLGWRLDAPLRNTAQTLMLTVPEIGKKGAKYAGRGYLKGIKDFKNHEKFLVDRGLSSGEFMGETARETVESGLYEIPALAKTAGAIRKFGELGMTLYSKSDNLNRYITWHIGQDLGSDILAGRADDVFQRLPRTVKSKILNHMDLGQPEAAKDLISTWLVRKTQFDYTKTGLSQFSQDFGRLVSMFSKWPIMVAGDITQQLKYEKGMNKAMKPMMKYIAPLALAVGGDAIIKSMDAEDNPIKKALIGASLVKWTAGSSALGVSLPPIATTTAEGSKGLQKAFTGDLDRGVKDAYKAIKPFIPGAVPIERFYKELPKIADEF